MNSSNGTDKKIGEWNIEQLFGENLVIPPYQRPYLWGKEQLKELLSDFYSAYNENAGDKKNYLVGNIILHSEVDNLNEDTNLNIVDGQQRIITFALILYALDKSQSTFLEKIGIKNPLSKQAIYENFQYIKKWICNSQSEGLLDFINENIFVTYIKTKDIDEAFILFDSQNSRGKALYRHDLLKAHHLRFIKDDSRITLAQKWESFNEDDLKYLLNILLLQPRQYIRGEYKGDGDIYKEFKAINESNAISNYNQIAIFKEFEFDIKTKKLKAIFKDNVEYGFGNGLIIYDALQFLPFEIIQSIGGGKSFFLFVLKFQEINNLLTKYIKANLNEIYTILEEFRYGGNIYLINLFYSILILYYDKFEELDLRRFSIKLFVIISHYRLDKYSVRFDGVLKFLRETLNIYQLIYFSFCSDELIKKLDNFIKYDLNHLNDKFDGVREYYYNDLLKIKNIECNFSYLSKSQIK